MPMILLVTCGPCPRAGSAGAARSPAWPCTSIAGLNVPMLPNAATARSPRHRERREHLLVDAVGVLGGERELVDAGTDADGVEQRVLRRPVTSRCGSDSVPTASGLIGIAHSSCLGLRVLSCRPSSPSMPALRRALASRSATTGRARSDRRPASRAGPRCQPSAMASTLPDASNTRPVTPADSVDASHVTIGAIQRGERISRSSSVSGAGPRPSVMRVSAHRGDGVDGDAVAGQLERGDVR